MAIVVGFYAGPSFGARPCDELATTEDVVFQEIGTEESQLRLGHQTVEVVPALKPALKIGAGSEGKRTHQLQGEPHPSEGLMG